jgi:hypothetical protein
VHPQCAVLDPTLHTPEFVRSRSALLFTAVLAVGSTALATLPHATMEGVDESMALQAHAEKLGLVVFTTGAKSCEIIQAQILMYKWSLAPQRMVDDLRWIRMGMLSRMATEIGLHRKRNSKETGGDAAQADKLAFNDLRTRAFLIMLEYG